MTQEKYTGWSLDNSYISLPSTFYSNTKPTEVSSPELIILNEPLSQSLGLNVDYLKSDDGINILAGNQLPNGGYSIAQAYAGHQYGSFTMLGDGRAIMLGEQITPNKDRFDVQLKGSGRTPYSRRGDGRAVLGPMLREYIISEAMYALGIPTTRSLAVVTTGEEVYRHNENQGAILTRIASSHIRVGTFEYAANFCNLDELRSLADYTIKRHFAYIKETNELKYREFLKEVINRQAMLVSKWQLVGFVHGVMNTDNMTISGETIDYGPCAFMDAYDPSTVFSSIDRYGRYAYGNQPSIAIWNLARFAESLLPLLNENKNESIKIAEDILSEFPKLFHKYWLTGMKGKLGLYTDEKDDEALIEELLKIMQTYRADFTNTFRALTLNNLMEKQEFNKWHEKWNERVGRQSSIEKSIELMKNNNPAVIPRNHRVEEALDAARDGDFGVMEELLNVLRCPYSYDSIKQNYIKPKVSEESYVTFCGT